MEVSSSAIEGVASAAFAAGATRTATNMRSFVGEGMPNSLGVRSSHDTLDMFLNNRVRYGSFVKMGISSQAAWALATLLLLCSHWQPSAHPPAVLVLDWATPD